MPEPVTNPSLTSSEIGYLRFMALKEAEDADYRPYHTGTTPGGAHCTKMPRAVLARAGVFRCPSCGKEWPTATAQLEALGLPLTAQPG